MKQKSTARKFELITGTDLYVQQIKFKKLSEKVEAGEELSMTAPMERLQYGLYLSLYEPNLKQAKEDYLEFLDTGEFDTGGKGLKTLVETWSKEIK